MKTLIALIVIVVSLTLTGCASINSISARPDLGQSSTGSVKVVGVVGVPASVVKGKINAVNVDSPATLNQDSVELFMKEKGLDYLLMVKVEENNDYRADKAAAAKKVGMFALSIALSAITRNPVRLVQESGSASVSVKVVTTSMSLYGSDGKLIRSKTSVKEMDSSEAIPASEVAAESLKELLPRS